MKDRKIHVLLSFIILVTFGLIIHQVFYQLGIDKELLPMHFIAILAGFLLPSSLVTYACALIIFGSYFMWDLPSANMLAIIYIELLVYSKFISIFYRKTNTNIFIILILSMITARVSGALAVEAYKLIFRSGAVGITYLTKSFIETIPAMVVQLLLIPPIIYALERTELLAYTSIQRKNTAHFNKNAKSYGQIIPPAHEINTAIDMLDIQPYTSVLDVGTGTGTMIPFVLERLGDLGSITGIDMSQKMLEIASNRHNDPIVSFVKSDIYDYKPKKSRFDYIICYSVFPYLFDPYYAFEKLSALLAPTGKLMILHPQSKESVNQSHMSNNKAIKYLLLPPVETLASLAAKYDLITEHIIDDENMYLLILKKSKTLQ